MLSRSPQGRIMEEAIQAFWEKAEEGFSTLQVEGSTTEVRATINEALAAHFGNPLAKELLRMSRGPTRWNGFVKDNHRIKATELALTNESGKRRDPSMY